MLFRGVLEDRTPSSVVDVPVGSRALVRALRGPTTAGDLTGRSVQLHVVVEGRAPSIGTDQFGGLEANDPSVVLAEPGTWQPLPLGGASRVALYVLRGRPEVEVVACPQR